MRMVLLNPILPTLQIVAGNLKMATRKYKRTQINSTDNTHSSKGSLKQEKLRIFVRESVVDLWTLVWTVDSLGHGLGHILGYASAEKNNQSSTTYSGLIF